MSIYITKQKPEQRAMHWRDIQTRVKTHEGEFLTGEAGKKYQEKWSGQYLGKDLSQGRPVDSRTVEEFEYRQRQKNEQTRK